MKSLSFNAFKNQKYEPFVAIGWSFAIYSILSCIWFCCDLCTFSGKICQPKTHAFKIRQALIGGSYLRPICLFGGTLGAFSPSLRHFLSRKTKPPSDGAKPFNWFEHWLGLVSRLRLLTKPNQCSAHGTRELTAVGA